MTDRRPYLVGESPSSSGDRYWRFPLSGAPARVLCSAAGIPPDGAGKDPADWTWALYERYICVNVIERWRDASPWSAPRAREAAEERAEMIRRGPGVAVLLGRRVGEAFGARGEFFEWTELDGLAAVVIPHPSGRNLLWNNPGTADAAGRALREAQERLAQREELG